MDLWIVHTGVFGKFSQSLWEPKEQLLITHQFLLQMKYLMIPICSDPLVSCSLKLSRGLPQSTIYDAPNSRTSNLIVVDNKIKRMDSRLTRQSRRALIVSISFSGCNKFARRSRVLHKVQYDGIRMRQIASARNTEPIYLIFLSPPFSTMSIEMIVDRS